MDHAEWADRMSYKIAWLRDLADGATDEEVSATLRDIADERKAELAFIESRYGSPSLDG